jgi:hypothetical protein
VKYENDKLEAYMRKLERPGPDDGTTNSEM